MALTKETSLIIANAPPKVDPNLWLYELCRLLVTKFNTLICALFAYNPPCSAETCPEMRASEWQYLCAAHDPPNACAAIDYCCHTLDWAGDLLASPKNFPSRLTLGVGDGGAGAQQGLRHLTNVCRRMYRIFAHAWFQHRAVFWSVEGKTGLYTFFKTICDLYHLIPEDNYTIPPLAEGIDASAGNKQEAVEPKSILKKGVSPAPKASAVEPPTTRRHKAKPSTGSFVTTVDEVGEEEEPQLPAKTTELDKAPPRSSTVELVPEAHDKSDIHPATSSASSDEPTAPKSASETSVPVDETETETAEADIETKVEKETTEDNHTDLEDKVKGLSIKDNEKAPEPKKLTISVEAEADTPESGKIADHSEPKPELDGSTIKNVSEGQKEEDHENEKAPEVKANVTADEKASET